MGSGPHTPTLFFSGSTPPLPPTGNAPYLPHTWLKFLDDIFVFWTEGPNKLKVFVDYLNNLHPTIKFTCSHSLTNIPFLDLMVSLKDSLIETDLYTKPTDKHNIYLSPHTTPPTLNVAFHIALHFALDASAYAPTMTLTNKAASRTYGLPRSEISRNDALKPKPKQKTDTVPFIITYNPAIPHISRITHPSPKWLPKIQISQN